MNDESKRGSKKKRLGKGLGALLGEVASLPVVSVREGSPSKVFGERVVDVDISKLRRGKYQPRDSVDEQSLEDLAISIRAQGVIQPLLVRPALDGEYEIIAGERRWRGSQLAGLEKVPVIVRDLPDRAVMAIGLIENIQRENLNAIEEAKGFSRLLQEFGLTHQEVAQAVGRSRAAVSNFLRLLDLSGEVQSFVEAGELEMGHARALLPLSSGQQVEMARRAKKTGMSVRGVEGAVRRLLELEGSSRVSGAEKSHDVVKLEEELSSRIGAKVRISTKGGKGSLAIYFHSLEELDGIISRIH